MSFIYLFIKKKSLQGVAESSRQIRTSPASEYVGLPDSLPLNGPFLSDLPN